MSTMQRFRDGYEIGDKTRARCATAAGAAAMFAIAIGICWLMVWGLEITWDRALLIDPNSGVRAMRTMSKRTKIPVPTSPILFPAPIGAGAIMGLARIQEF